MERGIRGIFFFEKFFFPPKLAEEFCKLLDRVSTESFVKESFSRIFV